MDATDFSPFLQQVLSDRSLAEDQAEQAMGVILAGNASPVQLAAFLIAIRNRGADAAELLGFVRAMRAAMIRVDPGEGPVLDTCGTGGDGTGTFNISTAAAFVIAGAGVKVAKHGNRSASSQCGSADVLEALGVNVDLTPERMGACIREIGIGFLYAPLLHPALRHAGPVRKELKVRTVMNLLGPLCNPAGASAQIIGVPAPGIGWDMSWALRHLDTGRHILVHGADGLDEVTLSGSTTVWIVDQGKVRESVWMPEDFGVKRAPLHSLQGGDRFANATIIRDILDGRTGPPRDVVVANAAAGLFAADPSKDVYEHARSAAAAIDSGAAKRKLEAMIHFTQQSDR